MYAYIPNIAHPELLLDPDRSILLANSAAVRAANEMASFRDLHAWIQFHLRAPPISVIVPAYNRAAF